MYGILAIALFTGALALSIGTMAHMARLYQHKALAALMGTHRAAAQNFHSPVYRRVRPERSSITLRAPLGPERIAARGRQANPGVAASLTYAGV